MRIPKHHLCSVVLSVAGLAACSGDGESPLPPDPPPPTSPVEPAAPAQTPVLDLPELVEGLPVLWEVPPTVDDEPVVHRLEVDKGDLWVSIYCQGEGTLTLEFAPLGEFEVPCTPEIQQTKNLLEMDRAHQLTFTVTTSTGNVRWSLRVQQ